MRSPFAALVLALACTGCFLARDSTNEPLARRDLSKFVVGQSTAQDVATAMGAPNEVVQLGRRSAWRYDHSHGKVAGLTLFVVTFVNRDTRTDRIWFFFDEQDRLSHVGSSFEADDADWAMPWQDLSER
jgi:hypothetical protein